MTKTLKENKINSKITAEVKNLTQLHSANEVN